MARPMSRPESAAHRAEAELATFAPMVAELSRLATYAAVRIVAIIKLTSTNSMATPRERTRDCALTFIVKSLLEGGHIRGGACLRIVDATVIGTRPMSVRNFN